MSAHSTVTDLGEFYREQGRKVERAAVVSWLRDVAAGARAEMGKAGGDKILEGITEDLLIENGAHSIEIVAAQLEAE